MVKSDPRPSSILLADDDGDLRAALATMLEMEGYEVVALADGTQTVAYLAKVADGVRPPPDLLILDFCMPGLSGLGIVRLLKSLKPVPPAILLSAFPDPSLGRLAERAGAATLLRKPVPFRDVLDAVVAALRPWQREAKR